VRMFFALLLAFLLAGCSHAAPAAKKTATEAHADQAVSCRMGPGIFAVRSILTKKGLGCSGKQAEPFKKYLVFRRPAPCAGFDMAKSASCHAVLGYYFWPTGAGSYEGCLHRAEGCGSRSCKTSWKIILTRRR